MKKNYQYHVNSIMLIAAYSAPYFVLHENMHIPIHDIFDDFNFISYQLLKADSKYLLAAGETIIPAYLGGQIRDVYPSELNLYTLLNVFAPLDLAYAINDILTRAVAYVGMYLLITRGEDNRSELGLIPHFVACAFALLPFWPYMGLAIAGSPLVIWAFLNIEAQKKTLVSFFILASYPFYSSFVYGGMFIIMVGAILLVRNTILMKKSAIHLLWGVVLIIIATIVSNYRLFRLEFLTDFVSHRTLWPPSATSFLDSLELSIRYLVVGQYHAASLHFPIIGTTGFLFAVCYFWKGIPQKIYYLMVFILMASIVAGFYRWGPFEQFKSDYFPFLLKLHLERVHFLIPLLVYLLFAQILIVLRNTGNFLKGLVYCLAMLQIALVVYQHPELRSYRYSKYECNGTSRCNNTPSLKQFVAKDIFDQIKKDINLPTNSYRVASLGLHPSISALNGLQTVDGYMVMYDVNYKKRFETVISRELSKSPDLYKYFHEWGSRAYIFSSELGKTANVYSKNDDFEITNLELDMEAFNRLGGQYIISAMPIKEKLNGLKFVKDYTNQEAFWKLYLYEYSTLN